MQVLLWITVFWVAYAASLILRGFVQLCAAKTLGVDVQTLWFGYRKAVRSWKWHKVTIALASWPTWAQIGVNSQRAASDRRKIFLSTCIAWSVNAAMAIAMWPPDFLKNTSSGRGPMFLDGPLIGAVFLANFGLCVLSFGSPSHYEIDVEDSQGEEQARSTTTELSDLAFRQIAVAQSLFAKGKRASAAAWLYRSLRQPELAAEMQYLVLTSSMLSSYGKTSDALQLVRTIRQRLERPLPEIWCEVSDGFASHVLFREQRDFLPDALSIIDETIAEFPQSPTLFGTRGGLYFDMGKYEEAARDLKHCNGASSESLDRGISSAFLAAIASRSGEKETAQSYAKIARNLAGDHEVVKRVLAGIALEKV